MRDESVLNRVEHYIADNFRDAQYYFPRLSHYLLDKTSGEIPNNFCMQANFISAKLFLYLICNVCEKKLMYIQAHKQFEKLLTTDELPDSYLKFNDGYVYTKSFNKASFQYLIEDTAMDVNFATDDIISAANIGILTPTICKSAMLNILKIQMDDCMQNCEDMCSNEYLEMCFMQSLTNVINVSMMIDNNVDLSKI